jgi:uncharacterized membrane protein YccC
MFDRNYYYGVLVVLVIVLLVMLAPRETRTWAGGALVGVIAGAAFGWLMAKAPAGKPLSQMY